MNVQELYQQKLTTAEEAVKIVKSGDWVDYGWCCNQPVALDKALATRKDELPTLAICWSTPRRSSWKSTRICLWP